MRQYKKLLFYALLFPATLKAEDIHSTNVAIDNLWVIIAAILVLLMQPGFVLLETGFGASKNAANVMFKNVIDLCLGGVLFYLIGYNTLFGHSPINSHIPSFEWIKPPENTYLPSEGSNISANVHFFYQLAFSATAATICSGAVAGRIHFFAYLAYVCIVTVIIYPVSGFWAWNPEGWLNKSGFHDFAGSIVVHSVGGFVSLAGILVLKPRIAQFNYIPPHLIKFENDPKFNELFSQTRQNLANHNLPLATLGMFLLWLGWFGFNAGSTLGVIGNVDVIGKIVVNTSLAGCVGGVCAMLLSGLPKNKREGYFKSLPRPELAMTLNGILGGLVGVTASCNKIDPFQAIIIGIVAAVLVKTAIYILEIFELDDAVGAFPVHGACGIWGGLPMLFL
jgi:Amt family ammonium transporter